MGTNPLNDLTVVFRPDNQDLVQNLSGPLITFLGPAATSAVFAVLEALANVNQEKEKVGKPESKEQVAKNYAGLELGYR